MKEHGPETAARGGDSASRLEAVTVPLKFSGGLNDLRARTWERIGSSHNPPPTIVVIPMALGQSAQHVRPNSILQAWIPPRVYKAYNTLGADL